MEGSMGATDDDVDGINIMNDLSADEFACDPSGEMESNIIEIEGVPIDTGLCLDDNNNSAHDHIGDRECLPTSSDDETNSANITDDIDEFHVPSPSESVHGVGYSLEAEDIDMFQPGNWFE
jgi:hypothetical protein